MKKIAFVGSREFIDLALVQECIARLPDDTIVISGGARGVDSIAAETARHLGLYVIEYLPEYDKYPPRVAPLKRNERIAEVCDELWAFWDGESTGTQHVMKEASKRAKTVTITYSRVADTWRTGQ